MPCFAATARQPATPERTSLQMVFAIPCRDRSAPSLSQRVNGVLVVGNKLMLVFDFTKVRIRIDIERR